MFGYLLDTPKVSLLMRKAGSGEVNPTRCEHVKRLLSARRRNTIYVALAATFTLGGWEPEEGSGRPVRNELNSDQPT